ncbi:hypothetical protein NEF87_003897 [Candidatus Lokiarchaeum ossiferum]|uniref:DUF2892 domain-containing protein n=1 Tax=Candidatus Lokiarchaeum ossiferum TaxID=2951803 RepID=A0ABY6HVQ9_9ARCH|nr:hypothetical protein NEF87_003897 [Candidatus Lokiarchaeum sp. B-35]
MEGFSKNSQSAIIALLGLTAIGAGYNTEMGPIFLILAILFVLIGWNGINNTSDVKEEEMQEEKVKTEKNEDKTSLDYE